MALLTSRVKRFPPETQSLLITPIFAALPPEQQMQVFAPTPKGMRKVILATNIAESSITINGVRFVIDTGCVKTRTFHGKTGIEVLTVTDVSKQQSWQRAGRAGREAPGKVITSSSSCYSTLNFCTLRVRPFLFFCGGFIVAYIFMRCYYVSSISLCVCVCVSLSVIAYSQNQLLRQWRMLLYRKFGDVILIL